MCWPRATGVGRTPDQSRFIRSRFRQLETGQGSVEYILTIVLIVLLVGGAMFYYRDSIRAMIDASRSKIARMTGHNSEATPPPQMPSEAETGSSPSGGSTPAGNSASSPGDGSQPGGSSASPGGGTGSSGAGGTEGRSGGDGGSSAAEIASSRFDGSTVAGQPGEEGGAAGSQAGSASTAAAGGASAGSQGEGSEAGSETGSGKGDGRGGAKKAAGSFEKSSNGVGGSSEASGSGSRGSSFAARVPPWLWLVLLVFVALLGYAAFKR